MTVPTHRRPAALLQRGSRDRADGRRLPRRAARARRSTSTTITAATAPSRSRARPARSSAASGCRARAMSSAACSPMSTPTSMSWPMATRPMTPPPRRRWSQRLLDEQLDMVVGTPRVTRRRRPIAAAIVLGNRAADRHARAAVRAQLHRHLLGLPRLLAPLREELPGARRRASRSRPRSASTRWS